MLNKQPPERVHYHDKGTLDVIDVFYTIQGEGPFSGCPAVFVRLAGCSIQCPKCDTEYTTGRAFVTYRELADMVAAALPDGVKLVVLTGGEPLRQNIVPFVRKLVSGGYTVQIETNGTLPISSALLHYQSYDCVHIVCSPKTATVHADVVNFCRTWKYIIEDGKVDEDGLPTSSLGMKQRPARPPEGIPLHNIYLQPLDTGNKVQNQENLEAAVEACRRHGYRVSIQQHKLLNLP